jgi:uncharacterized membrane protein (UPF0127 family)
MSRERGAVRVTNTTRGTVVGNTVFFAGTWWGRAKGWLGRPAPVEGEGLLLAPCKGIHMIGMSYAIDVAFLDEDGNVVATYAELEPWQRTRMHSTANQRAGAAVRHARRAPGQSLATGSAGRRRNEHRLIPRNLRTRSGRACRPRRRCHRASRIPGCPKNS